MLSQTQFRVSSLSRDEIRYKVKEYQDEKEKTLFKLLSLIKSNNETFLRSLIRTLATAHYTFSYNCHL